MLLWDLSGPYLLDVVRVGYLSIIPVGMDEEIGFGFLRETPDWCLGLSSEKSGYFLGCSG